MHSADGGGQKRPVVELDIEIAGKHIGPMEFNLNDRSNMDNEILIGQNILKAGNFVIDVQQDQPEEAAAELPVDNSARIREAVKVLQDNNVTLTELMSYMKLDDKA